MRLSVDAIRALQLDMIEGKKDIDK